MLKTLVSLFVFFTVSIAGNIAIGAERLSGDVVSGWKFSKSLKTNYKIYGYKIVGRGGGHPVRSGRQSIRFEVRPGDCGSSGRWNDCKKDRERHELASSTMSDGEHWIGWSVYIPKDYKVVYPTKTALGQFHQKNGRVAWMFQNHKGGLWVDNQVRGSSSGTRQILGDASMRGRWNDIVVHVNWTHKQEGFFRVYVNDNASPSFSWSGPTKSQGKSVYFKFGVYRTFLSRWRKYRSTDHVPTQVVYYDEVRLAKKRSQVSPR